MIFLTTFMLGNIFSEKIATHNPNYKDMVNRAFMEVRRILFIISKQIFFFVLGWLRRPSTFGRCQ